MSDVRLFEVQGSYWHPVEGHGKGGWRANLRAFVVTRTAEDAMRLWHEEAGEQAEIHQVICRSNSSMRLIVDRSESHDVDGGAA